MRIQDEEVTFNVFNAMKHLMERKSCFRVNIVEAIVSSQKGQIATLETSLVYEDSLNIVDEEARNVETILRTKDLVLPAPSLQLRSV